MTIYQEHVLNDGHVCSNCLARQRREVTKPVPYERADVDGDQNRVRDGDHYVTSYAERVRENTDREAVPDVEVRDQMTTFCECGVDSAYVRVWDDRDVDAARLRQLLKNLFATLEAKDFEVHPRQMARRADELYHELPVAGAAGRGIGPAREGAPTMNDVLEGAVEAGVVQEETAANEVPA